MYELIEIKESPIHGKGIFAKKNIHKATTLTCDVLIFENEEVLSKYEYPWTKGTYCLCIGFGSFFNHSITPNVKILSIDKEKLTKTFIVLNDIKSGEELTICYRKY